MLLTITTTHAPATDIGFLLEKHPGKVQTLSLSFVRRPPRPGTRDWISTSTIDSLSFRSSSSSARPGPLVHELVFSVLALESEPVDPRL